MQGIAACCHSSRMPATAVDVRKLRCTCCCHSVPYQNKPAAAPLPESYTGPSFPRWASCGCMQACWPHALPAWLSPTTRRCCRWPRMGWGWGVCLRRVAAATALAWAPWQLLLPPVSPTWHAAVTAGEGVCGGCSCSTGRAACLHACTPLILESMGVIDGPGDPHPYHSRAWCRYTEQEMNDAVVAIDWAASLVHLTAWADAEVGGGCAVQSPSSA